MEVYNELLNTIPICIITAFSMLLIFYYATKKKEKFPFILGYFALKYIVVNLFLATYLYKAYPQNTAIIFTLIVFYLLNIGIFILAITKWMGYQLWHGAFLLLFPEIVSIATVLVPFSIVSAISGYNVMNEMQNTPNRWNALAFIISFAVVILSIPLYKRFGNWIKNYNVKHPVISILIMGLYFSFSFSSYVIELSESNLQFLLVVVGLILIMIVLYRLQKQQVEMLAKDNEFLAGQQALQSQYFDSLNEQISLTRKMRHDLANHIETLSSLSQSGNFDSLQEYIGQLKAQHESSKISTYCNYPIVNAVLANKSAYCEKIELPLSIDIPGFTLSHMNEYDLAKLLFNLLDNAIHYCEGSSLEEKHIDLHIRHIAGNLMIQVNNSYVPTEKYKKGIGLSIVEDIVKNNNGEWDISTKDSFAVTITIPEN